MSLRVFSATLATETNTFAPFPTGMGAFQSQWYYPAGQHPEHMTLYSAPLWVARQRARTHGWRVSEGLVCAAQPGGPTTRLTYERLRDQILADLDAALPVDMVLLGLHGAMVAEGCDDCEGDLLQRVRERVGPDVVVGASLDPHCHLSPRMVVCADLLVAFKEYPHTDVRETAERLADLCAALAQRRIRPVAAVRDCAMISVIHTTRAPADALVARLRQLEVEGTVLSASIVHGFLWGDVPDMGTQVLVYADGDATRAAAVAEELRDALVARREALAAPLPPLDEALDQALAQPGPVVLADSADNPGGGAAGDSTFVLRRLIERGIGDVALGPLWDPVAVSIAFEAGLGATLPLRVGGKVGPDSGDPVDAVWQVDALARNLMMTGLSGTPAAMGDCALVRTGGVQVVLTSVRNQAVDTDLFEQLGCLLHQKRLVVVKSSHHFYESFSRVARATVYADVRGALTQTPGHLVYRKVRRPRWPLDPQPAARPHASD
jgi:microcystin degradation protein MlrC